MTATRQTRRIATITAALVETVIHGLASDFEQCALCPVYTAELFTRIDNRDGREIECCEDCADNADVSHCAE